MCQTATKGRAGEKVSFQTLPMCCCSSLLNILMGARLVCGNGCKKQTEKGKNDRTKKIWRYHQLAGCGFLPCHWIRAISVMMIWRVLSLSST